MSRRRALAVALAAGVGLSLLLLSAAAAAGLFPRGVPSAVVALSAVGAAALYAGRAHARARAGGRPWAVAVEAVWAVIFLALAVVYTQRALLAPGG